MNNNVKLNNRDDIKCHSLSIYDQVERVYKNVNDIFLQINAVVDSSNININANLNLINSKVNTTDYNIYKTFVQNTYLLKTTHDAFIISYNETLSLINDTLIQLNVDKDLTNEDIQTIIDAFNEYVGLTKVLKSDYDIDKATFLTISAASNLYFSKTYLTAQFVSLADSFSSYYNKIQIDAALLLKLNKIVFDEFIISNNLILTNLQSNDLNTYNKTQADELLNLKISIIDANAAFHSKTYLNAQITSIVSTFNLFYTKVATDDKLEDIYTKTEITNILNNIINTNIAVKYDISDQETYATSINQILSSIQADILNRYTKTLTYSKVEVDGLITGVNSNFNIYYNKIQTDDKFLSKVNYNVDKFISNINPKTSGVIGYYSTLWNYDFNNGSAFISDLYSVLPNMTINNAANWIQDPVSMQYLKLTNAADTLGYTLNITPTQIQSIRSVVMVCNYNLSTDANIYLFGDSDPSVRTYVSPRVFNNGGISAIEGMGVCDIYYDGIESRNNSGGTSNDRYLLSGQPLRDFYNIDKNTIIIVNNINMTTPVSPLQFFTGEFEVAPNPITITFHEVALYNEALTLAEIKYITRFYKQKYGSVPT